MAGSVLRWFIQIPSRSFRCEQRTVDTVTCFEGAQVVCVNLGGTTDSCIRPNEDGCFFIVSVFYPFFLCIQFWMQGKFVAREKEYKRMKRKNVKWESRIKAAYKGENCHDTHYIAGWLSAHI